MKTSIDFNEIQHWEHWELFAAEFLQAIGFSIESQPGRGTDGGKDLIVSERLGGTFAKYPFRWLVSCKHFAQSGQSVGIGDEENILERVRSFNSEGFLGFYSTLPSSTLVTRLEQLVLARDLKDARCLNYTDIEQRLISRGFADLIHRYFPASYIRLRPIHHIFGEYIPLLCHSCGEDLLPDSDKLGRIMVFAHNNCDNNYVDICTVCKGDCDKKCQEFFERRGLGTAWYDIDDLLIPANFMRYLTSLLENGRDKWDTYSDEAFEKLLNILRAISQRVLREMTAKDRELFEKLRYSIF